MLHQARPPPPPVPHAEVLSCSVLQVGKFLFASPVEAEDEDFWAPSMQPKQGHQFFVILVICRAFHRIDADDGMWKAAPQLKAVSMGAALAGVKPDKFIRAFNNTTTGMYCTRLQRASQHTDSCFCIHPHEKLEEWVPQ